MHYRTLHWDDTYCELSSLWILFSSRMCRFLTRSKCSSSDWISASSCIQPQKSIIYLNQWSTGSNRSQKQIQKQQKLRKSFNNWTGTFFRWPIRSLKISSCSWYSASDNLCGRKQFVIYNSRTRSACEKNRNKLTSDEMKKPETKQQKAVWLFILTMSQLNKKKVSDFVSIWHSTVKIKL